MWLKCYSYRIRFEFEHEGPLFLHCALLAIKTSTDIIQFPMELVETKSIVNMHLFYLNTGQV